MLICFQVGIEGTYLNIIQPMYDKPIADIILSGEIWKHFHSDEEQDKDVHF